MAATTPRRTFPLAPAFGALMLCMTACSGGDSGQTIPVATRPASTAPLFSASGHGYFSGEVSIAGVSHYSEALLTVDGEVRLYVGGPEDLAMYAGARTHPPESMLFVGRIDSAERDAASGAGAVIGQICDSDSARFCDEPAPAQVFLEVSLSDPLTFLIGELVVTTGSGDERWAVDLGGDNIYYASGASRPGEYLAVFEEHLAPFAQAEEMPLAIEPGGRMSFTSTASGCAGDGTILPHLDGQYDVHDIHLRITDCNAQFAYLNSDFDGLATEIASSPWAYDVWLVVFLSAPDGPPPRPALTMRAYLVDRSDEDSDE